MITAWDRQVIQHHNVPRTESWGIMGSSSLFDPTISLSGKCKTVLSVSLSLSPFSQWSLHVLLVKYEIQLDYTVLWCRTTWHAFCGEQSQRK